MESPRIHGGVAEEKSSCESGWTMYIEDTFHGNHHHSDVVYQEYDDDDGDGDDDFRVKDVHDDDGGDGDDDDGGDGDDDDDSSGNGSDDSMTSDASSWPSTQLPRSTKKNHTAAKNSNAKQADHQTKTKNRACEKFSDEEEESEFKARTRTTAASRVQSRGKVRKNK